ncbi:MAG: HEAT repeat domain-containing protein [Vicinamibacteria bacterium]
MIRRIAITTAVIGLLAGAARAQSDEEQSSQARAERDQARAEQEQERAERDQDRAERADDRYERAMDLVDDSQWQAAVDAFESVVREKDARADAALYWQAYAQMKQGRAQEAVAKIQALRAAHPKSRWVKEAAALELEIKGRAGQPTRPESIEDEELKLIAIGNLMHMDPAQALPLLQKILDSPKSSPKLKEKALFVLSQSGSQQAREVLVRAAKGDAYPGLQRKAIQNLGIFGGGENGAALAEIYAATAAREVKRAVLQAYMVSGQRDRLLALAKGEADASLRRDAIQQLGVMGASDEVWQMYAGGDRETKRAVLQALFVGGNGARIVELARTEKDPELRRDAIQQLGLVGSAETTAAMEELYRGETDRRIREAVLQAFFVQGNAKRLIEIARTEKDPELKRKAVQQLSVMGHPDATKFMLEILDK